jgi:uncharacterized repeat protein (TIGR03833 family)
MDVKTRSEEIIQDILTNNSSYPYGIKVCLESGLVFRKFLAGI